MCKKSVRTSLQNKLLTLVCDDMLKPPCIEINLLCNAIVCRIIMNDTGGRRVREV